MIISLKKFLIVSATAFAMSAVAGNAIESGGSVSAVTTTIEQPASAMPPVPTRTVSNENEGAAHALVSSSEVSKASSADFSGAVDNITADVNKNTQLITDLSSQINDLKSQIISLDTAIKAFEDSSQRNFKILLACLIALLVITVASLLRKCVCQSSINE